MSFLYNNIEFIFFYFYIKEQGLAQELAEKLAQELAHEINQLPCKVILRILI